MYKTGFELNNPDIENFNRKFTIALWIISALFLAFFALMPRIDPWVSALFVNEAGNGADRWPAVSAMRWIVYRLMVAGVMVTIVCMIITLATRKMILGMDWRAFVFASLSCLTGPAILANFLLKGNVPRSRPRDLLEFGGDMDYTAVLDFSGKCTGNCSFVSGEVATAAALFGIWVFVTTGRKRIFFLVASILVALFVGAIRVMMGAHFLSDVLLAWCFSMLACSFAWYWCYHSAWSPFVNLQKAFQIRGKHLDWE